MRTLRRLVALAPAERRLVVAAATLVAGAVLALRLLPHSVVRRLAGRLARRPARTPVAASRVVWAVTAAGRRITGGTNCLVQALAAHVLLSRHGHANQLRLGVGRAADRRLEAHAWGESEGGVLLGSGGAGYAALPATGGLP